MKKIVSFFILSISFLFVCTESNMAMQIDQLRDNYTLALQIFAKCNNFKRVKMFVQAGARVNAEDGEGKTPFKLATDGQVREYLRKNNLLLSYAKDGNVEEVKALLNDDKDVVFINVRDRYGATPLINAAEFGHEGVVQLLLCYKPDINARDSSELQETALHYAACYGYVNIVKLLVKEGAEKTIKNRAGKTAFDYTKNEELCALRSAEDNEELCTLLAIE